MSDVQDDFAWLPADIRSDWLTAAADDLARLDGYESSRVRLIRTLAAPVSEPSA